MVFFLGGVPGVDPGTVVIIGGGVVGTNAAKMACGLGAKVYVLDMNLERLRYLSDVMPSNCFLLMSKPSTIRRLIKEADVVVGAVLIPGSKGSQADYPGNAETMKKGAVLVDVAIDQGGCFETSKPTTHAEPIYERRWRGALLRGQHARGRAQDLGVGPDQCRPCLMRLKLQTKGGRRPCGRILKSSSAPMSSRVRVTYQGVADAFGLKYTPIDQLLKG